MFHSFSYNVFKFESKSKDDFTAYLLMQNDLLFVFTVVSLYVASSFIC